MDVRKVGKRLIIDGYVYKKSSQDLNKSKCTWECVRYRDPYLNCKARAITYHQNYSKERIKVHQGPDRSPHDHKPSHKEVKRAEKLARHCLQNESAHKTSHSASEAQPTKSAERKEKHESNKGPILKPSDSHRPSDRVSTNSEVKKHERKDEDRHKTDLIARTGCNSTVAEKDHEKVEKMREHRSENKPSPNPSSTQVRTNTEMKKSEESDHKLELKPKLIPRSDNESGPGRPSLMRDPKYYRCFLMKFFESLVFTRHNVMEVLKVVYKTEYSRTVACAVIFEHQEKVVEDLITLLNDPKAPITPIDDNSNLVTQNLSRDSSDAEKLELLKSFAEKVAKLKNKKLQLQKKCCSSEETTNSDEAVKEEISHPKSPDSTLSSVKPPILYVDLTDELEDEVKLKKEVLLVDVVDNFSLKEEGVNSTNNVSPEAVAGNVVVNDNVTVPNMQSANANNETNTVHDSSSLSNLLRTMPCQNNIQQQFPNMNYAPMPSYMPGAIPWMPINSMHPFNYVDPNLGMMNYPTMIGNGQFPMQGFGQFNGASVMDPMSQMYQPYQPMGFTYSTNPESFRIDRGPQSS